MSRERRPGPAERRQERAAIDDPATVLAAAVRFLETRSRSVEEVRRRLTGAGYRADLVDGAVTRLLELRVLDDAAFAQAWIESRDRARPRGAHALRRELHLKGVDRTLVDALLVERAAGDPSSRDDGDEAAARRLLALRASMLGRIADPRHRLQRAYALLARNGFDPDVCARVAREYAREDDRDPVGE